MQTVLGIDAAWTTGGGSGIALVAGSGMSWRCLRVESSYTTFVCDAKDMVGACRELTGVEPSVVAIDMPLSKSPIVGRRVADDAISQVFGGRWCSTHTPNPQRPGPVGVALRSEFERAGYVLVTNGMAMPVRGLIEVYPHPAILGLLGLERRHPYKVGKARQYWPTATPADRRRNILGALGELHRGLEGFFGPLPLAVPGVAAATREVKAYEDMLDALVCAWVGVQFVLGRCAA